MIDFIQILYQHDNPLMALDALKQNHNFYGNHHAIRILLAKMHQIYDFKPEQIVEFYHHILQKLSHFGLPSGREITHKFSVCRNPKLHILPFNDNTIINQSHIMQTPDYDMSAPHIQEYYHSIKNNAGIRAFNDRDMLDISGSDAIDFLKQIAPDFKNIAVGKHCFIHDKHCKTPILLFQYAPERFCAIMSDKAEFSKTAWQYYQENNHTKIALHKVNQSWAYLQLVGDKAIEIFEKIVKMPVTAIPNNHVSIWIENIQLRFVMYQRYNIQHIDMMIASDAAMSFYQKLTEL